MLEGMVEDDEVEGLIADPGVRKQSVMDDDAAALRLASGRCGRFDSVNYPAAVPKGHPLVANATADVKQAARGRWKKRA